jgi:predicted nucleic acid-binding Zn ribbon protein
VKTGRWVRPRDVIPGILQRWREERSSPIHRVLEVWTAAVGEQIAAHANPRSLQRKELVVAVDGAVWAAELGWFHTERILEAVNKALGSREVERLRFVHGSTPPRAGSGREETDAERRHDDEI